MRVVDPLREHTLITHSLASINHLPRSKQFGAEPMPRNIPRLRVKQQRFVGPLHRSLPDTATHSLRSPARAATFAQDHSLRAVGSRSGMNRPYVGVPASTTVSVFPLGGGTIGAVFQPHRFMVVGASSTNAVLPVRSSPPPYSQLITIHHYPYCRTITVPKVGACRASLSTRPRP